MMKNLLLTAIIMPNYTQSDFNNLYRTVVNNYLKATNFEINNDVKFDNTLDKNRKIHIGFLSNYIWTCPLEIRITRQIFKNCDKEKFKISCYTEVTDPHPLSMINKSYVDNYVDISKLKEKEAADLIRNDEVDIRINMDGPYLNMEKMFYIPLYKPAPVQVTFVVLLGGLILQEYQQ